MCVSVTIFGPGALFILKAELSWLGQSLLCLLAPPSPTWRVCSLPLRLPCAAILTTSTLVACLSCCHQVICSTQPTDPTQVLGILKEPGVCCTNQEATMAYVESENLFLRELWYLCLPPTEPIRKTNASYQEVVLNSVLLCLELLSTLSQVLCGCSQPHVGTPFCRQRLLVHSWLPRPK